MKIILLILFYYKLKKYVLFHFNAVLLLFYVQKIYFSPQ